MQCQTSTIAGLNYSVCYSYNSSRFTALCLGLPRWAGTRRDIYPLTPILHGRF